MTFTAPWEQHNYIGQHATDAAATSQVVSLGWDSGGSPQEGQYYYNTAEEKYKFWRDVSTGWEGQAVAAAQTVTVAESGGDFDSIKDAIDSITDASSSKPYVVLVYPGVYAEDPMTLKQFVAVEGVAVGASIVTPNNNAQPLFTAATATSVRKLYIFCPTAEAGIKATTGVSNVQVEDCFFSSLGTGQTAINSNGANANIIVEECKVFSSVATGLLADNSGRIDCSNVLSSAGTTSFKADDGTMWIHNSGAQLSTNGVWAEDGATIYVNGVTVEGATNALRATGSAESLVTGTGFEARLSVTNDVLQDDANGRIALVSAKIDTTKLSIADWDNFESSYQTTVQGAEVFTIGTRLAVGHPEKGHASHFGEGESYTRGQVVITTNGTAGPAADGGNLTDVSSAASSPSGSTFTFQGVSAGHAIYWGSSLDPGSGTLKIWGVEFAQTTAAVLGASGEFIWEIWNGSAWVEVDFMVTEEVSPYESYANSIFVRANSEEAVRIGIDDSTTWSRKSINGNNLYWLRCRIATAVTTAPVFEQTKLVSSYAKIGADGIQQFFGMARPQFDLLWHQRLQDDLAGASPGNVRINYASGINLTLIDNNFQDDAADGVGETIAIPIGLDTSLPVNLEIIWIPDNNTTGDVELESRHAVIAAVGSVLNNSISSTLLTDITTVPLNSQDTTFKTTFAFSIPEAVPGDLLALSYFRDATAGNTDDTFVGDVEIAFTRLFGSRWRV
jgi:hypothetical protein